MPDLPFDHDVHRVGASQLLIDPGGGAQRLLAVGHLVGQAVAGLELEIGKAQEHERDERHHRGHERPVHHPVDDPPDQLAETVHQPVGGRAVLRQLGLVADQERPHQRQNQHDGHEGDADGEFARNSERADQGRLREQQSPE